MTLKLYFMKCPEKKSVSFPLGKDILKIYSKSIEEQPCRSAHFGMVVLLYFRNLFLRALLEGWI